jgi:hypothetical protein
MTTTGSPTLSELLSWSTEHLIEGADYWNRTADRWDSAFAEVEQQIRASEWAGSGFDAATGRAYIDKVKVANTAEGLRGGASIAWQGASDISAAINRLRYVVEDAHDAGFDVYDDFTVTSRRTDTTAAQRARAESFAADIRYRAAQLVACDQQIGSRITTAVGHIGGLTFDEHAPIPQDFGGDKKLHRWTDENLYPHDPTAADIHQDRIGDCYLDATMGAIANANPQWIRDRIRYDDTTGNFDVTLWNDHQWQHITVSQDDIDTNIADSGASWLDNDQPNAALWPTVLESAYAKLKAPGDDLDDALKNVIGQGGRAQDAMEALTGNRGTNINPQTVWLTNQHIDQEIANALAHHQPVTISTTPHGAPLKDSHVYVVEGISGSGSDAQVTLRNPWEHNKGTPINTPDPLVAVRLGDLIGSGLTGKSENSQYGIHPTFNVNIGSLG